MGSDVEQVTLAKTQWLLLLSVTQDLAQSCPVPSPCQVSNLLGKMLHSLVSMELGEIVMRLIL